MGLRACTAVMVKGLESFGFTSCLLSSTGVAEVRKGEERRSRKAVMELRSYILYG